MPGREAGALGLALPSWSLVTRSQRGVSMNWGGIAGYSNRFRLDSPHPTPHTPHPASQVVAYGFKE
jgi:hypothetical protein